MIKEKPTANTIAVSPAIIADEAATVYAESSDSTLTTLKNELQRGERYLREYADSIRSYRQRINSSYRSIEEYKESTKSRRVDVAKSKKAIDSYDIGAVEQERRENLEKAAKLRYVDSIEVRDTTLVVNTRLIFTNIRLKAGERETARRCLGAFEIAVDFYHGNLSIKNKMFNVTSGCHNGLDHWAIQRSTPCQGEHRDSYRQALRDADLYILLEVIYHFLMSTDDGGAYCRSDAWIKARNERFVSILRKGNYVYITRGYDGYQPSEHGYYAEVLRGLRENMAVALKADFPYGHNLRGALPADSQRGYIMPKGNAYKISKEDYENETADLEAIRNTNPLEAFDALPFGSTLADGKKTLNLN